MCNSNAVDVTGTFALYNSFGAKQFLDSATGGITPELDLGILVVAVAFT